MGHQGQAAVRDRRLGGASRDVRLADPAVLAASLAVFPETAMALRLTLNTWEKHIAHELYSAVALVLVAFLMLFGFFDLIHELESINNNSYPILSAVLHVVLQLPGRAYELFPIAVLIGSLFALTLL